MTSLARWAGRSVDGVQPRDVQAPWWSGVIAITYTANCQAQLNACLPVCSTSDVPTNRRNIHHRLALLWFYRDSGYKTANLLTYLFII